MRIDWSALLAALAFVLALLISQPWRGDPGTVSECLSGANVACAWDQE